MGKKRRKTAWRGLDSPDRSAGSRYGEEAMASMVAGACGVRISAAEGRRGWCRRGDATGNCAQLQEAFRDHDHRECEQQQDGHVRRVVSAELVGERSVQDDLTSASTAGQSGCQYALTMAGQ
jgi:hypothetical protein